MDIKERVDKRFNKEVLNFQRLLEMIEQQLDSPEVLEEKKEGGRFSMTIPLPSFSPTEAWGDPESVDREHILKVFSVVRGGRDIKSKLQNINNFLDPSAAARKRSPGVIINMMMVVEALQATLNDFNESAAGFVFEAFMSALTGGKQITGKIGGPLPIEDFVAFSDYGEDSGVPVSLKLLTLGGPTKGSYTNLVDYLVVRGAPMIKYIVAYKVVESDANVGELQFWEFEVNRENFVHFIEGVGGGEKLLKGVERSLLKQLADNYGQSNDKYDQLELAQALLQTNGYTGGLIEDFLKTGGLTPEEEMDTWSDEQWDAYRKSQEKKQKKRERDIERGTAKTMALAKPEEEQTGELEINESFHQREKRLLQEALLLEGSDGATQWKATMKQLGDLGSVIKLDSYGVIDLSQSRIDQVAEVYIAKLQGSVMMLLEKTKSLAENIGSYFREERRNKANAAAEIAKSDAEEIRTGMEKDPRYN